MSRPERLRPGLYLYLSHYIERKRVGVTGTVSPNGYDGRMMWTIRHCGGDPGPLQSSDRVSKHTLSEACTALELAFAKE